MPFVMTPTPASPIVRLQDNRFLVLDLPWSCWLEVQGVPKERIVRWDGAPQPARQAG